MKIRRLELVGFKSFMEKTVVQFEDGITCVVGPNGCGKSNIVDAIFWVMGDQSAKHLRGKDMTDVIFAGSDKQTPSSMAEVNLTFSTEDGGVPANYADYSEITVTRRLYRSGESEYLINKTYCRLKDIAEFFMDTGVGAKAYSIIEQGQIGKIVSQKPEERRSLIEAAAGITKYKSRKREAQLKLQGTEQNLLRIEDIIAELKRQIESLKRQARKAERYKSYKDQIREIELAVMSRDFHEQSEKLATFEKSLVDLKGNRDENSSELEKVEALLQKLKLRVIETEKEVQTKQDTVFQAQQRIHQYEGQKNLKKKEIENLISHEQKDEKEKIVLVAKKDLQAKSQTNVSTEVAQITNDLIKLESDIEESRRLLHSETEKQKILTEQIEKDSSEIVLILTDQTQNKNDLLNVEQSQMTTRERLEELLELKLGLERKIAKLTENKESIDSDISKISQERLVLIENQQQMKRKLVELKQSLSTEIEKREALTEGLHSNRSRYQSLKEISDRYEGYDEGVQAMFNQKDEQAQKVQGVLADVIDTDASYEKAVEAVLQDQLQHVLVESRQDAVDAIEFLIKSQKGQASFLFKSNPVPIDEKPLNESSAELLWKKISVSEIYVGWVRGFLKNVYMVPNFQKALELWDVYPGLYTFVTPEGELINTSGVLRGGKWKSAHEGLLAKKRQIKELQEKTVSLERDLAACTSVVNAYETEMISIQEKVEQHTKEQHQKDLSHTAFEKDQHKAQEDLDRINEDLETCTSEIEQLSDKKRELAEKLSQASHRKDTLIETKKSKETTLQTAQLTLAKVSEAVVLKEKDLNAHSVKKASLDEKKEALDRQKAHLVESIDHMNEEILERSQAIELSQLRQKSLKEEVQQDGISLETTIKGVEEDQRNLTSLKKDYEEQSEKYRVLEEGLKKQRSSIHAVESRVHEDEMSVSKLKMSQEHLSQQVEERYQLRLENVFERYRHKEITEEDKTALQSLKEKTSKMGEVNLTAIEEFDSLSERYESLEKQKKDLVLSMESLNKTIEKINKISRKRFIETFEIVNRNFKKVFPTLFKGGQAQLALTDPNDLLETGVEIMAKPPGKKLQNMSLLSGGEKALTAVSLVFGIFLMKPSPFCLLDEVDAPLDDANVGRFNDMVSELTDHSQFIVITHNKKTMSAADVLYGVTMASPGISSLISVKLEKAFSLAKQKAPKLTTPVATA